jgi:UDP-N-acetylmuramyl tripeptide synthase
VARHNVANALAAIALASVAGVPVEAMAAALRGFRGDTESNPGRANLIEAGGLRILVDYAHNPHGLRALATLAASLPGARRLVLLGQAGDRDDESLRELARAAWALKPDHVVVKELPELLRGRNPGEVPAVLEDELLRLGAPPEAITRTGNELEGARRALEWARPGDVLLLLVHTQRREVMDLLRQLD